MKQIEDKPTDRLSASARLGAVAAALLCLGLLGVAPAWGAPFEGVGHFAGSATPVAEEKFTEEVQLGGVAGMAVNYTGAGGVPAGTVYAATRGPSGGSVRVAMFKPKAGEGGKDGGLKFSLGWVVTEVEESYERCGPDLLPSPTICPTRVAAQKGKIDVDVDQTTGNVYIYNGTITAGRNAIVVYSPDGLEVITRFGEIAEGGKKTSETPGQIHDSAYPGGIAVNGSGEVYVFDVTGPSDNFYHRLMKFRPKTPGNYEEYVYAGTAEDVGAGFSGEGEYPTGPVSDAAGNIYVAAKDEHIEMYDPANPADPPVCQFDFTKGGVTAITVNPASGEVFFFTYKKEAGFKFKLVHQLAPCDEETGEFEEIGKFEVKPERDDLWGLAFDPVRKLSASRAPGVLYGGAPGPVPDTGVGKGEPGQSSLGYIFAQAEENPPEVKSQSVAKVTVTSAQLGAVIDPKGFQTDYAFQYITEAAYLEGGESFAGAAEMPLGGATLQGTGEAKSVAVTLTGLAPDTPYRYRAVASSHCSPSEPSKVCEDAGAAQGFRTFPLEAPGLPDNRAYELVSPAQKHGGQVYPADPSIDSCSLADCKPGRGAQHFPMQSAPGGEAIVYEGTAFGPGEGAVIENQYIAHRDATKGWQSTNLTPSLLQSGSGHGYKAFDSALGQGLLEQTSPALNPEAPPEYRNLYSQPTTNPLALGPMLTAAPPNQPPGEPGGFTLSYASAAADLSRVFFAANDALTGETPFAPAAIDGGPGKFNLYEWEKATGQLRLVNVAPGNTETEPGVSLGAGSAHTISADGSRAFWSDGAGQLYVREDAEVSREIPGPGKFLSAATDGSKVLLDNGRLYDLDEETTTDLTDGKGGFEGLVGQSDDLSHLYFVDTAVLDEAPNGEGDEAEAGANNLYAWSEGATRYVATLLANDNDNGKLSNDWNRAPSARTAQASPSGRWVTFLSKAPLTGYDNTGPCEEISGTGKFIDVPCSEAFLYDSATDSLSCASCNPSGARPLGRTVLRRIGGTPPHLPQPRYLTDSGRLYFDSQDSLSLADTNAGSVRGRAVEDVYQYEPEGVGSCKRAGGCISLISAGREAVDSNFLAIDETGKNVFFTSRDRLVQRDKDELIDLYVAREDGGIPAETETTRPECQGEACQPAASAPNDPTPGSSSFAGPGNVKQGAAKPRCPKGRRQVQRKGKTRCVKRNRKRARAANRNRGGAK